MKTITENRKGQFQSVLLAVVLLIIIGILVFFSNHLFDQIYTGLEGYIETSEYNNTEAQDVLVGIHEVDNSVWDYAVLALVFGIIIQLIIFSRATRISPVFYWVFALLGFVILFVGAVLSNIWQEMAANPEFATTVLRFPITNTLLGSGFILFISSLVIMVSILVLFGKRPGEESGGL